MKCINSYSTNYKELHGKSYKNNMFVALTTEGKENQT